MKPLSILTLFTLSLSGQVQAGEASLEVAGVQVSRGMPEESPRSALAAPYALRCSDTTPSEEVVACVISTTDGSGTPTKVYLKDGRILSAWQSYHVPASASDAVLTLHALLQDLTQGQDTCAFVRVTDDGPSPQFTIALPEKYVAVGLDASGHRNVILRVGLRQNPTPGIKLSDCWPNGPASSNADSASTNDVAARAIAAPAD